MNSFMLLRGSSGMRKSDSLRSFKEYRQSEAQNPQQSSVHDDGTLLEYETLELRLHPPNVMVDNETHDDVTVVTIDSANRPGTLIEVVQTLTELNLSIKKARISSDGGWFVDEFFVSETPRGKVTDARKLNLIKQVLNVQQTDTPGAASQKDDQSMCAVFEIAGRDRRGLLASVMEQLANNACEAHSAAVWTYHNQVALVVSVIDSHEVHNQQLAKQLLHQTGLRPGMPPSMQPALSVQQQQQLFAQPALRPGLTSAMQQPPVNNHQPNPLKLQRLQGILYDMLGGKEAHVTYEVVRCDTVHHERRLHHLLLLEELKSWQAQQMAQQIKARQMEAEARARGAAEQQQQQQLAQAASPSSPSNVARSTNTIPPTPPAPSTSAPNLSPITATANGNTTPSPSQQNQHQNQHQQQQQQQGVPPLSLPGAGSSSSSSSGSGSLHGTHAVRSSPSSGSASAAVSASAAAASAVPSVNAAAPAGPTTSETLIPSSSTSHVQASARGAASPPSTSGAQLVAQPPATPSLHPSATSSQIPDFSPGEINGAPWVTGCSATGSQFVRNSSGPPQNNEKGMNVVGPTPGGEPFVPAPTALLSHDLLNYSYLDPSHQSLSNLLRAEVTVQHSALLKYHLVNITCKDRNKLFFDTVCTLADMNYDVYHGTIDSKGDEANQLFYAKPRFGECMWDEKRARKLAYMLECAVQRRFPRGIRILMQAPSRSSVPTIFKTLSDTGFWITRAEIRSLGGGVVFDFSLTDANGHIPSMTAVQKAFSEVGGLQAKELDSLMSVVSMGGVGAAAAAAAAWPPAQGEGAGGGAPGGGKGQAMPPGMLVMQPGGQSPYEMTRPIQMNMPKGKFTFAFAGSADQRRGPLQSSTSASLSQLTS